MLNICFLKQTKNGHFICSITNDRMFSVVHGFSKYSESKCLRMNYVSDYESYSLITKNFANINNLSFIFFSAKNYTITRHFSGNDK